MKHWSRLLALLAFSLLSPWAHGETTALEKYFASIETLKADFEQLVFDQRGRIIQEMKGKVYIHRPGRFRWDYARPYEQHIVADGERIWIYDVDLEQVTVKPQQATMGSTPALVLSEPQALAENFLIAVGEEQHGVQWFQLEPREASDGFQSLRLALDKNGLRQMQLVDSFDQTTELYFDNIERNGSIDSKRFEFTAPDGVDVFDETQF